MFFINRLLLQFKVDFIAITEYFKDSLISTIFFVFLIGVLVLNIIKKIFIWQERKNCMRNQACEYLVKIGDKQDCDIPFRRKRFIKRGNSCTGCWGKSFKMTDEEVENRIKRGNYVKHAMIVLANGGRSMLPYISFCYTLAIAIFENNK